jgi:YD repeat-containing protein
MADPPEPPANPEVEAVSTESLEVATRAKEAELAVAEETFEQELATPAAEREREASRTAYAQLTSSEASELLIERFGPTIGQLNEDPGRLLTDMEVEKMLGPNAARVTSPVEGREIIESSLPLISELGGEEERPLDLTLEREGASFEPANPAAPTQLPITAEGPVEVGEGVQIQIPTTSDHEAVQVGETSLFYPETEPATDTMLAPVAGGVEVFAQLRSPESPEELGFEVEVPDGAELVATPGGGAQVVDSEGAELEEVPPPSTVDAQGASVPTTMTVEGDSLVLAVDLAGSQVAYPALVDPLFLEEPTNFYEWTPSETAEYGYTQDASKLKVWSLGSNHSYGPYTHVQYTYATPGPTAWIESGSFSSISFFPNACGGNQPHGYIELYNQGASRVEKLGKWEGKQENGVWASGTAALPGTNWAIFGIGTDGVGTSLSCSHEFYLGNYSLQEKDTTLPIVTSVSGVPLNQWFDPAKVGTATITAEDSGFGVYEISLGNEGGVTNRVRPGNCTGVSGSRCPHVYAWPINPPYVAGKSAFYANAQDAMGNNTASGLVGYTYADPNAPAVELTGQFARATDEVGFSEQGAHHPAGQNELSLPTYVLHINAIDGSNGTPQTMESGVQRVQVFLDGTEQSLPWGTQSCPATESSCGLSGSYELKLIGLGAGVHKLKVVATDRVGHPREREIEFEFIPATGEGENQVLERFPLHPVDEEAGAGDETQPEVAVNVMNGNLVFHQQDAEVATSDAGLGIDRYYNSELPQAQSGEFGTGWTLDDTPELEPGQGGAGKATIVEGDGAMETAVALPAQEGQQTFDPATQASIAKVAGGYTVTDEGEGAGPTAELAASGQPSELKGSAEAELDLERKGGELSEIAVDDPGTAAGKAEKAVTESPRGFLYGLQAGGAGSAGGNLARPVATSTDSAGDVYVADAGHERVQEFGPTGAFLRQWGGAGNGQGQFARMVGIAVIGTNVYVAEPQRIEQFTTAGVFTREFQGTGNGKFVSLVGLSVDSGGHLWSLDAIGLGSGSEPRPQIDEFNPEGSQMKTAPFTASTAPLGPTGLAVEKENLLWVTESGRDAVGKYSLTQVAGLYGTVLEKRVGSTGTAAGQFKGPTGVVLDPSGNVWVVDGGNDRLEKFSSTGTYLSQVGGAGGGNAQFSEPGGIATDTSGNLWVADSRNDRVERLTAAGAYSAQAGGAGSAGGNLARPVATSTDSAGDVYVADAGHERVQEFGPTGAFLRQWGGAGNGQGQFARMVGIAVIGTNVYVAEPQRIEQFTTAGVFTREFQGTGNGKFVSLVGLSVDSGGHLWSLDAIGLGSGSEPRPQIDEFNPEGSQMKTAPFTASTAPLGPTGLAVEKENLLWVTESGRDAVGKYSLTQVAGLYGTVLEKRVGSTGTAAGQFKGPTGVVLDPSGNVWVVDGGNDRVQEYSAAGKPLGRFGRAGGDAGQFSGPSSAATDASGNVWIANTYDDRIERWTPSSPPSSPPVEPAPAAGVTTSGGLVQSIQGAPTGSISYQHEATRLTGTTTPEGTSHYVYDAQHRLQKIELPHGTSAEIGYDTIGRVISLKIVLEGATAETTNIEYDPEGSRETVVRRPKKAAVHYAISEEGSVLKWWNTPKPPEIEELQGSLWAQRGEVNPGTITIGDQSLETKAYSPEGLHSIQIVANGNQIVAEKTCEKAHDFECLYLERIYVTETGNWPPGIVPFEVIATDTNGFTSARRFWDNFPYTPPPADAELEPPTFEAIQRFREEFGLDLDLKGNERGIAERIFNLIDAWHEPNTPEGQVARASMGRWGVPLRAADVAEMEYRERYTAQAADGIPAWAASHGVKSNYAGYYVDQRQGGVLHVGFTSGQEGLVNELKSQGGLLAPSRTTVFQAQPNNSLFSLGTMLGALPAKIAGRSGVLRNLVKASVNVRGNVLEVSALDTAAARSFLNEAYGSAAPITVVQASGKPVMKELPRARSMGKSVYGGDWIEEEGGYCSVGFGASERLENKPNQEAISAHFALTAGHCGVKGASVSRVFKKAAGESGKYGTIELGTAARVVYGPEPTFFSDGEAVRLDDGFETPKGVYLSSNQGVQSVKGVESFQVSSTLCTSGAYSGFHCGVGTEPFIEFPEEETEFVVETTSLTTEGDSGGSVWDAATGKAVGLIEGGPVEGLSPTFMTPLLSVQLPGEAGTAPGLLEELDAPGGSSLNIAVGK